MEETSISIINKNNGQLTGESAKALPIKIMANLSWVQYIFIGVVVTLIIVSIFISTIQDTVVAVEVSGRSNDFQVYEVK